MAANDTGSDALAEKLLAAFASIPKEKIEACALIAKTAKARVRKAADGTDAPAETDDMGLSQDAQDAIRSAFRIIAPYSAELTPDVMAEFQDALGIEADEVMDDAMLDDAVPQDPEIGKSVAAGDGMQSTLKDDTYVTKDDGKEDDEKMAKAADGDDDKKDDKDSDKPDFAERFKKSDGMPDFDDADEGDTQAAMSAARKAFSEAMIARGKKQKAAKTADGPGIGCTDKTGDTPVTKADDDDDKDGDDKKKANPFGKKTVEKSATSALEALPAEQRAAVEHIFKSQSERMAQMEQQHKEMVAKSANLETELRRKEFVAKAASHYSALGRAEDVGEGMLRLWQKDPEGLGHWESIMKAANAQAQAGGVEGLFGEIGTAMSAPAQGSAEAQIKAHIDSVVQKSGAPKSREQIEAEFYETPAGRNLYAQSVRESQTSRSL